MKSILKSIGIIVFILLALNISKAQDFDSFYCDVVENGTTLKYPFAGGLNNPQFYNMDIDRDGVQDLVIFDKAGEVFLPFINTLGEYIYSPSYQSVFPECRGWVVIKDYNQDGIEDIFTFPTLTFVPGIQVYTGQVENGRLSYQVKEFTEEEFDILYFSFAGNNTNLYVSSIDIPSIVDVDDDGDLDILTFEAGGSYVWYYKNTVVEKGMPIDTFSFILEDQCWGKFFENDFSQSVLLSADPSSCAQPLVSDNDPTNKGGGLHSGSTVLSFDEDGDGDLDMLIGDLASESLVFLKNSDQNGEAWIESIDADFPSYDVPVNMQFFLAPFYVDANADGKNDLLVSPNTEGSSRNDDNVLFYENISQDLSAVFEYRMDNLFVGDMIDMGSYSHPTLADVNADGLIDIIIGSSGEVTDDQNSDARLMLYQNTGTPTNPKFELVDEDFLNMLQYKDSFTNLAPAAGDLDGDGDVDIIVANRNGDLTYYENIAGQGAPFDFATPVFEFQNILAGTHVKPQIFDLNGDGLGDLILGENNGNNGVDGIGTLNYYENIGTVGDPVFNSDKEAGNNTETLGLVDTRFGSPNSKPNTSPLFIENEDGLILLCGSESGRVFYYDVDDNDPYQAYTLETNNYGGYKVGEQSTLAAADLNSNGKFELILGNRRGGLSFYETDIPSGIVSVKETVVSPQTLKLSPSISSQWINVELEASSNFESIQLIDMTGRLIETRNVDSNQIEIDIQNLSNGVYIINAIAPYGSVSKRFVKI